MRLRRGSRKHRHHLINNAEKAGKRHVYYKITHPMSLYYIPTKNEDSNS